MNIPARSTLARRVTGAGMLALTGLGVAGQFAATANADTGLPGNMAQIEKCESGGNPTAQNPSSTASGLFQDLDTTWRGLPGTAGYARAMDAPANVQIDANIYMYEHDGTSPWLASEGCWGKTGATGVNTTTGGGSSSSTSGSSGATATVTTPSGATTATTSSTGNTASAPANPFASVTLTKAQTNQINALTKVQEKQSWWTKDAATGKVVTRTVVAPSKGAATHTSAQFDNDSTDPMLANGTQVQVKYLNIDWAQITSGPQAGRFISSGLLNNHKVVNGFVSNRDMGLLPGNVRAFAGSANVRGNLSMVKSLVTMDAAYQGSGGTGSVTSTEDYASYGQQAAIYRALGAGQAKPAGHSDHGLGLAANLFAPNAESKAWLKANSAYFGLTQGNPSNVFTFNG